MVKIINYCVIILLLIILTVFIFIMNMLECNQYCIKVDNKNIDKVTSLIDYLQINDIKSVQEIKLSQINNTRNDDYYIELSYTDLSNESKNFKEKISIDFIGKNNRILQKSIDYIKSNGSYLYDLSTYVLLINDSNIDQVKCIIDYLKIDNVKLVNKVNLNNNYDITIYYTTTEDKELTYQYHFEQSEIGRYNPVLDSILYIEQYGNEENKNSSHNIVIIYILISVIIVLGIITLISLFKHIIEYFI